MATKKELEAACREARDTIEAFLIAHYNVDEEEEDYADCVAGGRIEEMYKEILPTLHRLLGTTMRWSR